MLAVWVMALQGVTAARLDVDGPRVRLEIDIPCEHRVALGAELGPYLRSRVGLEVDGLRLPPASLALGPPARIEWRAAREVRRLRLSGALFVERDPGHRTRIDLPGVGAVDLHRHSTAVEWVSPRRSLRPWLIGLSALAAGVALAATLLWRMSERDPFMSIAWKALKSRARAGR